MLGEEITVGIQMFDDPLSISFLHSLSQSLDMATSGCMVFQHRLDDIQFFIKILEENILLFGMVELVRIGPDEVDPAVNELSVLEGIHI